MELGTRDTLNIGLLIFVFNVPKTEVGCKLEENFVYGLLYSSFLLFTIPISHVGVRLFQHVLGPILPSKRRLSLHLYWTLKICSYTLKLTSKNL